MSADNIYLCIRGYHVQSVRPRPTTTLYRPTVESLISGYENIALVVTTLRHVNKASALCYSTRSEWHASSFPLSVTIIPLRQSIYIWKYFVVYKKRWPHYLPVHNCVNMRWNVCADFGVNHPPIVSQQNGGKTITRLWIDQHASKNLATNL